MKKLKVGILGTGDVGKVLGCGLLELGHEVKMGSREPNNPKALGWAKESGNSASAGTFSEAAAFGDLIVLATLGTATEKAINLSEKESRSLFRTPR